MFALLALAGDLGGTLGPMAVGFVSGISGDNLKTGLFAAVIFPAVLVAGLLILRRSVKGKQETFLQEEVTG